MFRTAQDLVSCGRPLREIRERDLGGKAWNLCRLHGQGFSVPAFCVVTSRLFEKSVRPWAAEFNGALGILEDSPNDRIDELSTRLQGLVRELRFSENFIAGLFRMLDLLFGSDELLSVRSSVLGEDSARHSFAGQMESFLNVRRSDIPEAIKNVWASAFSSRALLYRKEKRIRKTRILAAVIIQKMVDAAASGVLFTKDPDDGSRECIVSAGFGLGEGVVSNRVETDTYRIPWHGNEISKKVAVKDFLVTPGDRTRGGTSLAPVPEKKRREPVLSDEQILLVRDIGLRIERSFGAAQDIEWAFDQRGSLFILQARPVIFADRGRSTSAVRVWDNSNIVESYPGLTLPLTFSFIRRCYERIFREAALKLTIHKKALKKRSDIFGNMVGLLNGRVYYNLLNWYAMQAHFPGFRRHQASWDQMIGISRKIPFPRARLPVGHRLSSSALLAWKLLSVRRTAGIFFRSFNKTYDRFQNKDLSQASEKELISVYSSLDEEIGPIWYHTLHNDFCAMTYYDGLKKLCSRWGFDSEPNLHNNLLCGEPGIESVAPVRSLVGLAEIVRGDPAYRELFRRGDSQKIWQAIVKDPPLSSLRKALDGHLRAYGDRSLEELKLENPTFREDPARLIGLIREYERCGLTVSALEEKERKLRRDAEAAVRARLTNQFRRMAFTFVLRNTRRSIANRENMRFARTRLFGIIRRIFRRMGDLLKEKGVLDQAPDIYYLTVDEVFDFIQGTAVTQDLRALVKVRKAEYRRHAGRALKERFETDGIPYLHSAAATRTESNGNKKLTGISCSSGKAEGRAKVVLDPRAANGDGRYILVAPSTDPGWVFLMVAAKGIVTERGSVLSHTAIIGRELGIPTIAGVKDATRLIPDGADVFIDGSTGEIQWQ